MSQSETRSPGIETMPLDELPRRLPVLPLIDAVVFPRMAVPLLVGKPRSLAAVEHAYESDRLVLLVAQRDPELEEVSPKDLYRFGSVALIRQLVRVPDGTLRVIVQGQARAKITSVRVVEDCLVARYRPLAEPQEASLEIEALMRSVLGQLEQYVEEGRSVPSEMFHDARNLDDPGWLADLVGFAPELTLEQRQQLLETLDVSERLRLVSAFLGKQLEILELRNKIHSEIQEGMEKTQKEYLLREQLRAIQKELGEDPQQAELNELKEQIESAGMPDEVKERALKELDRLQAVPPASPETGIIRTYIDWLVYLPWAKETTDQLEIAAAAQALEEDHYGLEKVKDRILEFLAVRRLSTTLRSPILCFVGPPGVGKTSLGRSIARAMGREFVRLSLGGVRDEAEIRGHRRTYVGAMPGRIIRGMRDAGTKNPIFMLDEIDKLGMDFRGDPSSALLEVLDPEQNAHFSDHYLEVPFDLSRVIFVTTANLLDPIPPALRDRMEVIQIPGYTEEEKLHIARRFLLPRQLTQHGLADGQLTLPDDTVRQLIRGYTKEAGVRNLEREIAHVCRKVAKRIVEGAVETITVAPDDLARLLDPPRFEALVEERRDEVGVAYGLTVSEVGGDVVAVEATWMEGKPRLTSTGQLGNVMQESAQAALTVARQQARGLGIEASFFEQHALHVHVPAGSVPKDGPSAGITMTTAIVAAMTGRLVSSDVAMTGEITLRGRVLPIGGVKHKVLAAHRAGVRAVILPAENKQDLSEIPEEIRKDIELIWVDHINAVLKRVLRPARPAVPVPAASWLKPAEASPAVPMVAT